MKRIIKGVIRRLFSFDWWGVQILFVKYFFVDLFCFQRVLLLHAYLPNKGLKIGHHNLGDDLNLVLLKFLTNKIIIPYRYATLSKWLKRDVYMCIGSNLDSPKPNAIVWGNGSMCEKVSLTVRPKKILAVRGPLTRANMLFNGWECPEIYGDPALLMPYYYQPKSLTRKYAIGIVPHMVDLNLEIIQFYKQQSKVQIIDIQNYKTWRDFIDRLCECEFILSSSLHGIILSDAYHIPNMWIKLSDKVLGDGFKFRDYFGSVGKERICEPLVLDHFISVEKLLGYKSCWQEAVIDLDKLMSVCPFNK